MISVGQTDMEWDSPKASNRPFNQGGGGWIPSPSSFSSAVSRLAGLTSGQTPAEVTEDRAQAWAHEVVSGESLVRK